MPQARFFPLVVCLGSLWFAFSPLFIHLTKDNHTCLCQMLGTGKEKPALTLNI